MDPDPPGGSWIARRVLASGRELDVSDWKSDESVIVDVGLHFMLWVSRWARLTGSLESAPVSALPSAGTCGTSIAPESCASPRLRVHDAGRAYQNWRWPC